MNIGPDHYRYRTSLGPKGVKVYCEVFKVVKETPRCYYLMPESWVNAGSMNHFDWLRRSGQVKRVLKDGRKRFAYPDRTQALRSFAIRQQWREKHAKQALSQAQLGAKAAREMLESGETADKIHCGHDDYTSSLRWVEW